MPIDISRLQVSMEEGERWRRTLHITIPSELLQAEREATMKKLSARLKLPGFRSGKVPAAVLQKRFGPAVDQELLDRVIGEAYREVLRERALRPITEGEIAEVDFKPDADLTFQVSFDVAPEFELARTGGFQLERPALPVSDEDIERVLERVREQEGKWVPVEGGAPASGERVSVRIERLDEAGEEPRRYEFVLGAGEAVEEIEGAITSLQVGESGEFTVTLPGEEGAPEQAEPRQLRIFLDTRSRRDLPELNDDLAKAAGDFQTLGELRDRIREDLEQEAGREVEGRLRIALIEQILAANSFEIPESMIDQYVRSALGNPKELPAERFAEAKEHLRPRALHTVKRFLIVDRVAEQAGLAATEAEVDARVEEIALRTRLDPAEAYARMQKAGQIEALEREITEGKVFDHLKAQSTIAEAV